MTALCEVSAGKKWYLSVSTCDESVVTYVDPVMKIAEIPILRLTGMFRSQMKKKGTTRMYTSMMNPMTLQVAVSGGDNLNARSASVAGS